VFVPPAPSLSVDDTAVTEGNSGTKTVTATVWLSAPSARPVTVDVATANGTATAGSDYVGRAAATLTFAAGETSKSVTVTVNGDTVAEPDETFSIGLTAPDGAALGDAGATVTIVNDDKTKKVTTLPPAAYVNDASAVEGAGGSTLTFTVRLSAPATGKVSVAYTTVAVSATAGTDFTAASGTVSFAKGQNSKTVTVTVRGDTAAEPTEQLRLDLSKPLGLVIGDGSGTGTIVDDD
jgi:chitinase